MTHFDHTKTKEFADSTSLACQSTEETAPTLLLQN
jgi:hypothetical protein